MYEKEWFDSDLEQVDFKLLEMMFDTFQQCARFFFLELHGTWQWGEKQVGLQTMASAVLNDVDCMKGEGQGTR